MNGTYSNIILHIRWNILTDIISQRRIK